FAGSSLVSPFHTTVSHVLFAADERGEDAGAGCVECETPTVGRCQDLRAFWNDGTEERIVSLDDNLEAVAELHELARPGWDVDGTKSRPPGLAEVDATRIAMNVILTLARSDPFATPVSEDPHPPGVAQFWWKLDPRRQGAHPVRILVMKASIEPQRPPNAHRG